MSKENIQEQLKLHPIQTNSISVRELYIKANEFPDPSKAIEEGVASISVGHSQYDEKNKTIRVAMKLEVEEEKKAPFIMKIELVGEFLVNEKEFPIKHIYDWAKRNAPLILMPYLREHAYSLTLRAGFQPVILALAEVPTFKLQAKKSTKS